MDEQKKYSPKFSRDPDPWDEASWQTGSTEPPKDRGGLMALMLILVIFLCGIITVLIRFWGSYPEGVSFAILLMNILSPYIEKMCTKKPFGKVGK